MSLSAGMRLGPYDIVALLGSGGMGAVYQARDTRLNRDVAIKVLPALFAGDPERLARFQHEAQVLASLNHPHIAHIHGLEESNGIHALVMELVEGEDLTQRIARGPIALDESLPIARQIADALEAAHDQGIIHRDLKPANIKVRSDGTVKVLDFGLAKTMAPGQAATAATMNSPTLSLHGTQAGVILGTVAYMSPEQAAGKPVDRRSDLWAFGVVVLEMLTGRPVFTGETVSHVLASVLRSEPDWTALPPGTPASIRRLLRRCLEKDRKRRLADAADARLEIDEALAPIGDASTVSMPRQRAAWQRSLPWALTGALALTLILVLWAPWRRTAEPRVSRATITTSGPATLTLNGTDRDLAVTPGMRKIAITGGPPITLARVDGASRGATFASADTIIFGTDNPATGLQRLSADGGTPEVLTRPDRAQGEADHCWPEMLPGGRAVLFTITSQAGGLETAQVAVRDLRTGTDKGLLRGESHGQYVAASGVMGLRRRGHAARDPLRPDSFGDARHRGAGTDTARHDWRWRG
jgi:serine/threonine protein kinase